MWTQIHVVYDKKTTMYYIVKNTFEYSNKSFTALEYFCRSLTFTILYIYIDSILIIKIDIIVIIIIIDTYT